LHDVSLRLSDLIAKRRDPTRVRRVCMTESAIDERHQVSGGDQRLADCVPPQPAFGTVHVPEKTFTVGGDAVRSSPQPVTNDRDLASVGVPDGDGLVSRHVL
jgi:hypothetical protein